MAKEFLQGVFKPQNPQKYDGNVHQIIYRSSWELKAFKICDETPQITKWSSEEVIIPYISPVDGNMRRYYMDLKITVMVKGIPRVTLVEIKPFKETQPPKLTKNMKEATRQRAIHTWAVNSAKWKATEEFCRRKGWHFTKWTERELDINGDQSLKNHMRKKKAANKLRKKKVTARFKR